MKKYKIQGKLSPFFRCCLVFFFSIFFLEILSPPPPYMGPVVFLIIGLTQTCITIAVPPLPHMGTLPKHQEDDKVFKTNS